jgi:hypothetical protein
MNDDLLIPCLFFSYYSVDPKFLRNLKFAKKHNKKVAKKTSE